MNSRHDVDGWLGHTEAASAAAVSLALPALAGVLARPGARAVADWVSGGPDLAAAAVRPTGPLARQFDALGVPAARGFVHYDVVVASGQSFRAPTQNVRQTAATGGEWYEYFAGKYGAQNVEWVSGSGRTIAWPSELPLPANTQMFRVRPPQRSSTFISELESVAGSRPAGAIGHHNQPLGLNGVDDGLINGSWQFNPRHQNGHNLINGQVNQLPYGTEIRIRPGSN